MRKLVTLISLLTFSTTASAQEQINAAEHRGTVYLVVKTAASASSSVGMSNSVALISIPMESMDSCEEEGARLISSARFDVERHRHDGFECIRGK